MWAAASALGVGAVVPFASYGRWKSAIRLLVRAGFWDGDFLDGGPLLASAPTFPRVSRIAVARLPKLGIGWRAPNPNPVRLPAERRKVAGTRSNRIDRRIASNAVAMVARLRNALPAERFFACVAGCAATRVRQVEADRAKDPGPLEWAEQRTGFDSLLMTYEKCAHRHLI